MGITTLNPLILSDGRSTTLTPTISITGKAWRVLASRLMLEGAVARICLGWEGGESWGEEALLGPRGGERSPVPSAVRQGTRSPCRPRSQRLAVSPTMTRHANRPHATPLPHNLCNLGGRPYPQRDTATAWIMKRTQLDGPSPAPAHRNIMQRCPRIPPRSASKATTEQAAVCSLERTSA